MSQSQTPAPVKQSRWRSKVMWATLMGLLGLLLQNLGILDMLGLDLDKWNVGVGLLLGGVAAFGIINDPTTQGQL